MKDLEDLRWALGITDANGYKRSVPFPGASVAGLHKFSGRLTIRRADKGDTDLLELGGRVVSWMDEGM